MTTIASQITSLAVVYSTLYSDADQRKHQSSASLAFVWGIHRDRWIPRTKGELRGKCFHLMTSSCVITNCGEHPHIPSHPFFFLNSSSRLLEENITRKYYLYAWSCLSFFFSFLSLLFLLIFWSGWISIAVCGPISARGGTLRWRHNDHAGVSNHQPHGCLLNRLFRRKSKKTSKLRVTGLCAGNSPGTGEFPAQMASYAENVSIWWCHHELSMR